MVQRRVQHFSWIGLVSGHSFDKLDPILDDFDNIYQQHFTPLHQEGIRTEIKHKVKHG